MNTSPDWQYDYDVLTKFICNHPEIEIDICKTRIPDGIREQFYALFNKMLSGFIAGLNAELLVTSVLLSECYQKTAQSLTDYANIKISNSPSVARFALNPSNETLNSLFEVLWDLLKGKITANSFSSLAVKKINETIEPLFIEVYQQWILFSLLIMLDFTSMQQVALGSLSRYGVHKSQLSTGSVPAPINSTNILFSHESAVKFIVPNVIAYSAKLAKYCGFRSGITRPLLKANKLSSMREWACLPPIEKIVKYNQLFIYLSDTSEDIRLVADTHYLCKPDVILEFLVGNEAGLGDIITRIERQHEYLRPPAGTFIIFANKIPEMLQLSKENMHVIGVEFERDRLQPLIDRLVVC